METKVCTCCGTDLPISHYHYANKSRGIRKSVCRDCSYKKAQDFIAKDPIAHHHYMKRYYNENPEKYPGNHISKKLPSKTGVYIVDCLLTEDSYVGCTTNLRNREWTHFNAKGKSKNKKLAKLVNEYGREAFEFRVLEYCDKEDMFELETKYIQELNPNCNTNKKLK